MNQATSEFQIGKVAQMSALSIDTIRYYEKQGLLREPGRSIGGFRKYPLETVEQLRFIKKARGLGLTLAEIKRIQKEQEKSQTACCLYVEKLLNAKLQELKVKLKEIHNMEKHISSIMKNWIPPKHSQKQKFVVCPQIERQPEKTKRKGRSGRRR